MPNAPQPGRIAPIKLKGASPSDAASLIYSAAQKMGPNTPKPVKDGFDIASGAALAGPMGGGIVVAGKIIEKKVENKNRQSLNSFQRDLQKYGKANIPKTKKRISGFGQALFIVFAILIDALEIILDAFAVGLIANRIIDIVAGILFMVYALFKGLSIADDFVTLSSIIGTIAGEMIPVIDIAPFFTIDAFWITQAIKAKDKARQKAIDDEALSIAKEQDRQNWMKNYEQELESQEETSSEEDEVQGGDQKATRQEPTRQDDGGAGRIAPIKPKAATAILDQRPANTQSTGKLTT
jgi:hypothetical protein